MKQFEIINKVLSFVNEDYPCLHVSQIKPLYHMGVRFYFDCEGFETSEAFFDNTTPAEIELRLTAALSRLYEEVFDYDV